MKQNILFTCAGRRNYLIDHFKEALNGRGKIIAIDEQCYAPALVDADISYVVPNIYHDNYISILTDIVKKHAVTAIISLNDLELPIISDNKDLFEKNGAKAIISNPTIIDICFDKWKTFNFFKQLNFNVPKTYIDLNKAITDIEKGKLKFPLVLKPRWGSSSINVNYPESLEELKLSYKLQSINNRKKISNKNNLENIEYTVLIQEKLDGTEYGMDILNDFEGNYYGSFAKEKLMMRCGETDIAKSIINVQFENLGKQISKVLKHVGTLDCDVFIVNDKLYILELNPRFGGGYPFSHEAGINIAAIYIEWLYENKDLSKFNKYKENITFSKCDRLVQNFASVVAQIKDD